MARIAAWIMGFVVLAAPVWAAKDLVTTFTLDNGMEVVVIEDHRAPAVVHMVWYRAGSADEERGVSGVAHFLEHLLFKGTDTLAPGEFSKTVAANGGNDNAFTSFDYTAYFQRVAADRLGQMMAMEADRMVNLRLTEADILTEREVIIEERNQRVENDPGALFMEQRRAAQYLNHPYGTPIIGWRHEMETLDLDDALAYYREFYAPNNAILIVAGDADPDEVRRLAEEHYGKLPPNPDLRPRERVEEPRHLAERRLMFRDARVAQPYVARSYLAPERDSGAQEEAAALTLLAELLGGGQTSVLTQKLQFETQQAVYTTAFYDATSLDDSTFTLLIVPAAGVSLEDAEKALDATVAAFLDEGVDETQLERIKFQLRASEIYERDNAERLARRYGAALTSGLTVEDVQAWPDILQSVTPEDIIAAGRKVFDRRTAVTGYLMPAEEVTQ
ncbi:insulinase family protein [Thalassococcus sp. CAU 1522]|uniref:Insulinase family protein n=1 Tax=Thalassococcus arenae TaxID=2851652 RepID=A0ABS6N7Z6_9RHOB|nr:pitrilysin family protein [Thalassococcus arenae]MBV2360139.1 insulinase family protein [Thalassococcus arenae]